MASTILTFLNTAFSNNNFGITIEDIRMRAGYPGKCLIVLESCEDEKILKDFFADDTYLLNPHCKSNAEKIVRELDDCKNVISILDRDYDSLLTNENAFYYDYCNLEMMMVHDDLIFDSFLNIDKLSPKELVAFRDDILFRLKPYSCLRQFNNMFESTKCKQFDVRIAYPSLPLCLGLSNEQFIDELKKGIVSNLALLTDKQRNRIVDKFVKFWNDSLSTDSYSITNGHDFNMLLVHTLSPYVLLSASCFHNNSIYDCYKRAFNKKMFLKTDLYKSIEQYQKKHKLVFVS